MFTDLPPNAYQLHSSECDNYIDTLKADYGISAPASAASRYILNHLFQEYGGYDEPASNASNTLAYHNGSHAAYVMGATVWLLATSGASQTEIDLGAVCGAGHDYRHHSTTPGEDERQTVDALRDLLSSSRLSQLAQYVGRPILGTIVEKIDRTGITQRALKAKDNVTRCLADADLSALAASNAGEWALRLYQEHTKIDGVPESHGAARSFLENTVQLQRNHRYTTALARRRLQPMARRQSRVLETRLSDITAQLSL